MRQILATIAFAAATVSFVAPASAATYSLGNLSAVSPVSVTRTFDLLYTGAFTDYYTFTIDAPSTVSGSTSETDGYVNLGWIIKLKDLDVANMSLAKYDGSGYVSLTGDASPETFSFTSLAGGDYRLAVSGSVVPTFSLSGSSSNGGVSSYTLTAAASATTPVAAPVPEASDLAMTALGLAGVAFWARRRKSA